MVNAPKQINLYRSPPRYTEKLTNKQLIKMSIKEFTKYAEDIIQSHLKKRSVGLGLRFPYDLKCKIDERLADCHPLYTYTAFLNNAGTICHVVCAEDPDLILRIKFRYSIKHLSSLKQRIAIWFRVGDRIDIGPCPIFTPRVPPKR